MKGGMIFQTKFCAITTSKIVSLCTDEHQIIIQEIRSIQQYYPPGPRGWLPVPSILIARSFLREIGNYTYHDFRDDLAPHEDGAKFGLS